MNGSPFQSATTPPPVESNTLPIVREAVRKLLLATPAFLELDPARRRKLAEAMVAVSQRAASLLREEIASEEEIRQHAAPATATTETRSPPQLARAQSAGSEFSGVSASRVAGTTRDILNAVSFPRFVTELINGVFKAMVDSNRQQMQGYVELLNNVSASTEGFADSNLGADRARQWLAERYTGSFVIEGDSPEDRWEGEPAEPSEAVLRLRPGATMPSAEALRTDLGLAPGESVPIGDPEQTLVPLARRVLARQRQQMLATMVMLGMQRIVVDSGRINASMRFHIDTRSAAQEDRGSQFDFRNTINAAGSFGFGPWGASASMTNTIGYVSTQKTQTTEEMNTDLDLNSSVELVFKTDYLPLERMAGQGQIDRIKVNTLNPEAEAKAAAEARGAREKRYAETDVARRVSVDKSIGAPPVAPPPPAAGADGSPEKAKANQEKAAKDKKSNEETKTAGAKKPSGEKKPDEVNKASGAKKRETAKPAKTEALAAPDLNTDPRMDEEPRTTRRPDVIFDPTPPEGVDEMLALAGIGEDDLVYDLGCGDGRLLIAAAQKHGCRCVGFDLDPQRVTEARHAVQQGGVGQLVRIELRDLFTVDLADADVVFAYLLPQLNARLIPQISKMKPGARIVANDFAMDGIVPDRVVQIHLDRWGIYKTFYLWTTPLKHAPTPIRHQWANSQGIFTEAAAEKKQPRLFIGARFTESCPASNRMSQLARYSGRSLER